MSILVEVTDIQVGGINMHFAIKLADGRLTFITIRDIDGKTICYGDGTIPGIPSLTDVVKEIAR